MGERIYICSICGDFCINSNPDWTVDRAKAEYEKTFKEPFDAGPRVSVCSECYSMALQIYKAWQN